MAEKDLFNGRKAVSVEETQFTRYLLEDSLIKGIAESGYAEITPMQEKMVQPLLERDNLIAQVSRGAGKTAGYLIPILHTLSSRMGPRALIITPTRDLAIQVYNEIRRLTHFMETHSTLIDPGSSINTQVKALDDDPEIVIGTPGRLLDHMRRGSLKTDDLDSLVLDEVDRMLDHGQRPDVEAIVKKIYNCDQYILLSPTISPPVLRLCRKIASEAVELFTAPEKPTLEAVRHSYFKVEPERKIHMIRRLIERECPERALVFCRTKLTATSVTERLRTVQGGAMELHMGIPHRKQEQIIKRFREGEFNILVTTDTFTHDLDIENISHVINFDIPEDPEDYTYRIGKTARLGARGRAMTLVSDDETELFHKLEAHIGGTIEEEMLAGMEPEAPPPVLQRARPAAQKSHHETETKPRTEYLHGGWHRKRPRRGRR